MAACRLIWRGALNEGLPRPSPQASCACWDSLAAFSCIMELHSLPSITCWECSCPLWHDGGCLHVLSWLRRHIWTGVWLPYGQFLLYLDHRTTTSVVRQQDGGATERFPKGLCKLLQPKGWKCCQEYVKSITASYASSLQNIALRSVLQP